MNKEKIIEQVDIDLFGDIDDVIKTLVEAKATCSDAISIRVEQDWVDYDTCYEKLFITRWETDEEYKVRLIRQQEREEQLKKNKQKAEAVRKRDKKKTEEIKKWKAKD